MRTMAEFGNRTKPAPPVSALSPSLLLDRGESRSRGVLDLRDVLEFCDEHRECQLNSMAVVAYRRFLGVIPGRFGRNLEASTTQ